MWSYAVYDKLCIFFLNFSPAPQLQNVAGSYIPVSMAAAGQLKQDPNAATTNVCKVNTWLSMR